jgi:hypothetical protein
MPVTIEALGPGIWRMAFPFALMGIPIGRNVTLIELPGRGLLIHSTAAFGERDVAAIRDLGEPVALLDATCFHDTFGREGRRAFPELPYFAPHHFPLRKALSTRPLGELTEWGAGEIELLPIEGMPKVNEHVVYHPRSKSLIVADLCFNFLTIHASVRGAGSLLFPKPIRPRG